jgi:hypothetical protein
MSYRILVLAIDPAPDLGLVSVFCLRRITCLSDACV